MAQQPCLREFVHRGLTFSNRLGLAPLTRGRAGYPDGVPNELHVEYYTQRATGGFILSEVGSFFFIIFFCDYFGFVLLGIFFHEEFFY